MDLKHGTGLALGTSRGRQRRGRRFIRDHGTIAREMVALEMLVKGASQAEIARELGMSPGGVSGLVKRALEYRAEGLAGVTEQARTLLLLRYETLLKRLWGLATGDYVDPVTGISDNPPSLQAVDRVLKILEAIADITGAAKPAPVPPPGQVNIGGVHVHTAQPAERDELTAGILLGLAQTRAKAATIEGHLADARTSMAELTGDDTDDRPGPPPRKGEAA